MKIYTRGGDKGTTQLLSVGRVPKDHLRLMAYGDIDELNSVIGLVAAAGLDAPLDGWIPVLQDRLFVLGSEVAVPQPESLNMAIPQVQAEHISELENWIDQLDAELPQLSQFILPGGCETAARLHVARTVCRRAERGLQSLNAAEALRPEVPGYINRLSDLLFQMARYENLKKGVEDIPWDSGR
ncbi:MAG: cob(I)yrinic acid a,c-diamide adenosyltransferase [Nevskiales bacterium]